MAYNEGGFIGGALPPPPQNIMVTKIFLRNGKATPFAPGGAFYHVMYFLIFPWWYSSVYSIGNK